MKLSETRRFSKHILKDTRIEWRDLKMEYQKCVLETTSDFCNDYVVTLLRRKNQIPKRRKIPVRSKPRKVIS